MADHSKPLTTSTYVNFVSELDARFDDLAVGLDPAVTTATNLPTNSQRWSSASNKWQKWNGTTWGDLATTYAISISGTAGNVSGTVSPANGGTGLTSYTVGDIVYASGTSTISKLADVAVGNVLISGGVGVAPSYGKVGLSTHVSGTLPITNGGTGSTATAYCSLATNVTGTLPASNGGTGISSYAIGDLLYASGTTTVAKLADVATGNALISGGVGVAPSYGKIGLSTHVSGTLPVTNGGTGSTTADTAKVALGVITSLTGSSKLPSGTSAQRDGTPSVGYIRYNIDLASFEGYSASGWGAIGGGAKGGVGDDVFYENASVITQNYSVTAGKNAMSAGPLTINDGVTVVVPSNSNWTIV